MRMGFVPYQVDYAIQNTAKTLGFTKKKVVFKFGFANPDSLQRGLTGAQCRGSEHELTYVWSLTSGKRQLFLDGRDVHFSESGQNGWTTDRVWQHAFTMKDVTGNYRVHFISQPKNPDLPDSKPFDVRVAGVSYFSFNRIFQLGTPTMTVRENNRDIGRDGGGSRHRGDRESPLTPEERQQIAAAKVESLRDVRPYHHDVEHHPRGSSTSSVPAPTPAPPAMAKEEPNLLSFDDDFPSTNPPPPPPPAAIVGPATSSYGQQFTSSVTMDPLFGGGVGGDSERSGSFSYGQPPPPQPLQQQQQLAYGQAPPPPPQQQPFGQYGTSGGYGQQPQQQPSYGQSSSSYSSFGQVPSYGQPPQQPQPQQQQPSYSSFPTSSYGPDGGSAATALTPYQAPPAGNAAPAPSPYALNPLASPSGQSYVSYGSAPSFAQPPRAPLPQQQSQAAMSSSSFLGGGGGVYPPAQQQQQPGGGGYYMPQQQQQPQPGGYAIPQQPQAGVGYPSQSTMGSSSYGDSPFAAAPPPAPAAYGAGGYPAQQYQGY